MVPASSPWSWSQRERYAAVNQPEAPRRLGALTTAQAEAELAQTADSGLAQLAMPDLIPHAAPRPTGVPRLPWPR
ncbi:hypothetical protein [Streptomyces griseicoloratus]|uniref:hypothetical protein n=1 Tax=Streptomyces griseicoloratus TaxID=2752516 RepID=UPI001CB6EDF4|nr:hypothetical protein [Streptomyces griseicoloratus]